MHGFAHATILSHSFRCLRKERLAQWPPFVYKIRRDPPPPPPPGLGRGTSRKIGWGYAIRFLNTLFQTKMCDFPHPSSDLIRRVTICYDTYTVGVNI